MSQGVLDWVLSILRGPSAPQPPGGTPAPVSRKVLVLVYDPAVLAEGGRRLSEVMAWNNPQSLMQAYINDLRAASGGYANYQVVEVKTLDHLPVKQDGFNYEVDGFLASLRANAGFHQPDEADYERILRDENIHIRVRSREIDEVWLFGPPYAGFYESRLVGPGAFFCNSEPILTSEPGRRYVVMGFNYQRGVGEMLESFGHRAEFCMQRVYRRQVGADNLWERFIRHEKSHPGKAEVGTIHYAPNSEHDYDWGNQRLVWSGCDNWLRFPDLGGAPRQVSSRDWGSGDIRLHHLWWLERLPRVNGQINRILANWWEYVLDPNRII